MLHALSFLPYFPDDSYISLRYAKRLANGLGLTWTDGERVEGYSNLLWIVLVSAVGFVTKTFVVPARVLGVVCTAASIAAMFWAHRVRPARVVPGVFAGLAVASSGAVCAYAIAGLEQPLLVALLTWGLVLTYPIVEGSAAAKPWLAGLMFGLLAVTRPDGVVFGAAAIFAVFVVRGLRGAYKPGLTMLAIVLTFVVGQLIFRLSYYEAWVPNTYHAKVSFNDQRVNEGLKYLASAVPILTGLLVTGAGAIAVSAFNLQARRRSVLLLIVALAHALYLVAIGGDFFFQYRFIVPLVPILALLGAETFAWSATRRPWIRALGWLAAVLALAQLGDAAQQDPQRQFAVGDQWHFSGRQVGAFLRHAFSEERPLLAVDAAGSLPYFYELPALDMLGLTDRHIAAHRPSGFGRGYMGHELGDGKYVLSQKPDLIAFWTPVGGDRAQWRSGREMQADPSFYQLYQAVSFDTFDGIQARLWVRKEDGRVGIRRSENAVVVPGFLLSQNNQSVARLDDAGRLGVTILDRAPAELDGLRMTGGNWRVHFIANGPIQPEVSVPGPSARTYTGPIELDLVIASAGETVNIRVTTPPGASAHLLSVQFTRLEPTARSD